MANENYQRIVDWGNAQTKVVQWSMCFVMMIVFAHMFLVGSLWELFVNGLQKKFYMQDLIMFLVGVFGLAFWVLIYFLTKS